MKSEKSKLWLEAGILFSEDPNAEALCPECKLSNLVSMDIKIADDSEMMERLIYCPECEAKNYLRK